MYRITWLSRSSTGLKLHTLTTPCAFTAVTTRIALGIAKNAIAPRLWTRNNALIPC